jgi:hypothetical protein
MPTFQLFPAALFAGETVRFFLEFGVEFSPQTSTTTPPLHHTNS